MSLLTSVLRIGPTDESKNHEATELLKSALLSHFETDNNNNNNNNTNDQNNNNTNSNNLMLVSNRYFSARVLLHDLSAPLEQDHQDELKEDGVILVFDALGSINPDDANSVTNGFSTPMPFDGLTVVHEQAEKANQCGELLRLCVGVSIGEKSPTELRGNKHEEEYSRRVLWCLDRGYEYVEADLSQEGLTQGHDERDKNGFARIVEAISGTMWSSAKMAERKQRELQQSYQEDKEKMEAGHDEGQMRESENLYIPPGSSLLSADSPLLAQLNQSTEEDPDECIQASLVDHSKLEMDEGFADDDRVNANKEMALNDLEGMLREAKRIREASMSGELSDDERRQRAADAAMLMMGLMDQLDLNDDESSQEEASAEK